MDLLRGKVAVITGGARGIGYEIAKVYLKEGAVVVYTDLSVETVDAELKKLADEAKTEVYGYSMNVSDEKSVVDGIKTIVEKHKRIDIFVNNAGITKDQLIFRMPKADWDAVIAVNLTGAFICSREVSNVMLKQKSGSIINMASIVGKIGNAGQVNYSASKGGLIAMTKSLAREIAARQVRVNAIAPGFIKTAMTDALSDDQKKALSEQIPMKILGNPVDIANAALFLASDLSSYITGHVLDVNGGMLMD
jgi:3-oxoacyl-[acyl-carrier protein] reductase